jgi:hypothetical protein
MGQEADCTATLGKQTSKGRAYLETDALIFRGGFRLSIPYKSMAAVQVKDGRLTVGFSGQVASFNLGARAQIWGRKILSPKSLLDKLGVKSGQRVAVLGVRDAAFLRQLRARTQAVMLGRVRRGLDAIFLQADRRPALAHLSRLRTALAPAGGLWVVAPKGVREITEADVLAAGKKAELVDVKVVRFSDTHTAHKFVIPKTQRL